MRACVPVVVVVLAGCSKLLGFDDVTLVDGGAPPNTVIGRFYTRCATAEGTAEKPTDLSQDQIRAMIPDAAEPSGFRVVHGVGNADGTFRIDGVPDGVEYYFATENTAWVTDRHVLDVHNDLPARCEPSPAHATTASTLDVAVTGLTPWHENRDGQDALVLYSTQLAYYERLPPLDADATSATTSFDWRDGTGYIAGTFQLPDAAAGDDLRLAHTRQELSTGERHQRVTTLVDVLERTDVTLPDGGTATLGGTMMPVPRTSSITLALSRGLFDAGFDPATAYTTASVTLYAHPVANDYGYLFTVPLASVDFLDWSRGATVSDAVDVAYGDPFPAAWARLVEVDYFRRRYYRLPGTTVARYITAENQHVFTYAGGTPTTTPPMAPVANVRITGTDGLEQPAADGGLVRFDGIHPITITWNPVTSAKQYLISIRRVYANGSDSSIATTGAVYTASSTVVIPPEMFAGGQYFVFDVYAIDTAASYGAGELSYNGLPLIRTVTPSGLFRFSARCGDGTVDAGDGEQCDGSGETATCDVDCSTPACGDGLRNAAFGEACDTVVDTPACDSDCTPVQCGDGHVNRATEDCDDGDASDSSNGCSATCKFNNTCGDGIVQSQVESCDAGGVDTATCDSDCTNRLCGDGHVNAAAGEECDYGGFNGHGHCSTTCKLQ